ncbi:FUSC family protein [Roseomonas sp. HJA6]|uniref:FUSC family protein n=1 Tax=Roseomonas alba TaxID=2846776 RepID=A0ABS7AD74_9PROT|nr:FUSC family protein [Neoroseomonas alba]MBW6400259.1 FUSC family protein [Neoroseomonas alba]
MSRDGLPATFAFDLRLLNPGEGLRSGLALTSLVLIAVWADLPILVWPALAAWLSCLADPGGPLRDRVRSQILFGIGGALLTAGFGLLGAFAPLPVAVAGGTIGIFLLALLRALGMPGVLISVLLSVVLVLALSQGPATPRLAEEAAVLFLLGTGWAVLVTAVLWWLRPFQTARHAVARGWRALAGLVADLEGMLGPAGENRATWDRHARAYRRDVRLIFEEARARIIAHAGAAPGGAWRLDPVWQRLEAAEQVFDALVALADLLEHTDAPPTRAAASRLLKALGPLLEELAVATVAQRPCSVAPRAELLAHVAALPESASLRPVIERLLDGLDAAAAPASRGNAPTWGEPPGGTGWTAIRAQLRPGTPLLRHALRLAVLAAGGLALTLGWRLDHGWWLAVALLVTLLGASLGAGAAVLLPSPLVAAFAVFLLAAPTAAVRRVSFGLFVTGLSAVVVVLLELERPGHTDALRVALERALYTLAGGAAALAGAALLWPDWAGARLAPALRAALVANLRYAALAVSVEAGEGAVLAIRRTVGQTSAQAEELLQKALFENALTRTEGLAAALSADAAMRRAAGRVAALRLSGAGDPTVWRAWFEDAATALAAGATTLPQQPTEAAAPILAEIGRQFALAVEGLGRLERSGRVI